MALWHRFITILLTIGLALWAVPASANPMQEDKPTIRFGAVLSLTGRLDHEGQLVRNGYELWREQVNARGGIPVGERHYQVEILYRDDQSDARNTGRLLDDLIAQDAVDFLLGPYGSDASFEAAATAEQRRIPMVQGGGGLR
ncbi:MAG TPA: hypothetical protein ENO16_05940 [Chromatiales bacterium]|nr:hypothetical protein [Chromatiales bacterium]